jgi:hypothetical protein
MDPVANLPDSSTKTSGLGGNILASLTASIAAGDSADGLFANFLSQIQTPPPPPPPANTQANATPSTTPASDTNQSNAQQNTNTPDDTASNNEPATNTPTSGTGSQVSGKSWHHDAKPGAHKDHKAKQTPASQTAAVTTPVTVQPAPSSNDQPATPVATTPTVVVASTSDTIQNSADNNNAPAAPNAPSAPAGDPTQNADLPKIATTPAATPLAPTTPSSAPDDQNQTDDTGNNDITASQLSLMLMQIQRLATKHIANTQTTDPNALAAQNPNADALPAETTPASGAQGKTDWKNLLAANAAAQNDADTLAGDNGGDPSDGNEANGNVQSATTAANTPASLQNTLPNNSASDTDASNKWMNASFLNLFNVAGNNQNNVTPPPVVPGTGPVVPTESSDGASLDTDMLGQGGASAHNAADGALTTDNTSLPTAPTSQTASTYDFASQLSAMRATKGGPTGLPAAVEQVMMQLSRGVSKDGSSQMTIQLRPAELGRVDIKLNVGSDGKVQGTVTADNPATLGLLLKDVRGLERALQEAGLRADSGSLQFNLRGDGQNGGSFAQNNNAPNNNGNNDSSSSTSSILPAVVDVPETYYLTPGGVNMRV